MPPAILDKTRRKRPPPEVAPNLLNKRKTPPFEAKEANATATPTTLPEAPLPEMDKDDAVRSPGLPPAPDRGKKRKRKTAPAQPPEAKQDPRTAQDKGVGGQGAARAQAKSAGETAPAPKARTWAETRELYPYLVDEAMALVDPAALERILPSVEDGEAQALDKKIKKTRNKLFRAIMESARMKDMEMPTICLFSSTKLQPKKLGTENGKTLLVDHLDKTDHMDICDQGRLARVEHEVVKLRQVLVASQYQEDIENIPCHDNLLVKGTRCESAESGLQSVVEENQIPSDLLQKETGVPIPHRKDEEVTSLYRPLRCKTLVGKTVLLHSIIRPHAPVAKAILQATSLSATVGGVQPGTECCKVFVYDVLQGEAPLLHKYRDMTNMRDAFQCSIAWPRKQIRCDTNSRKAVP